MLAYGIIGKEYSIASSIPEKQFFGQFNSGLQNRVLAIINEGQNGMRDCIDRIKDFITEDTISIEHKGKDLIILDNTTNFIGDTNNFNILNISIDDRRFVWTECSSKYIGNKDYFDSLANECQNDESLSAFYHIILEEVNDKPDLQKTRPITDIYLKLQKMNLPNPFKFLIALYDNKIKYRKNNGQPFKTEEPSSFYEDYKTYCSRYKYEPYSFDQFESKLLEASIKKVKYQGYKKFRIYKDDFETFINTLTKLE